MSVLKEKRNESNVQFLVNARDLEIFTMRKCLKIPKRYGRVFTEDLVHLSANVYNNLKMANSIYPTNKEKIQRRTSYFDEALRNLYCLISQVDIAKELMLSNLTEYAWIHWLKLINEEITMISAIKKSDTKLLETMK